MAKQKLGSKKTALCSKLVGKAYNGCYTRGGWDHFWAECWYSQHDADMVNYKTGEYYPDIRQGQFVKPEDRESIKQHERT